MGKLLNNIYKGSHNAFNIIIRKSITKYDGILQADLTAGAITTIQVSDLSIHCNLLADTGFLVLKNEKNETETIKYLSYVYDNETQIYTFTVSDTISFNYQSCLSSVVVDYGRIDCTNIDVKLVIKDSLDGNAIIDKTATKINAEAGMFELVLNTSDTDIAAGKYYYTIAQIAGSEVVPFENSTFSIIEDCIN